MCLNIPDLEVLLSETERGVPKFLRGGGTMYNIAVLEANQNQAALLKALIEKNVHKEVLNVITCPSIVELAKYLSDGNIASMLFC